MLAVLLEQEWSCVLLSLYQCNYLLSVEDFFTLFFFFLPYLAFNFAENCSLLLTLDIAFVSILLLSLYRHKCFILET